MVSGSGFADSTFYFSSPGSTVWGGVYVNPYTANELSPQTINGLTIYCDDWDTEFSGNPTWNAKVLALTPSNAQYFKFGTNATTQSVTLSPTSVLQYSTKTLASLGQTPYDLYLEAVYLDQQMQGLSTGEQLEQEELSAAEWILFTNTGASTLFADINGGDAGKGVSGATFATAVNKDLQAAAAGITSQGFSAAGWDVITPVGNDSYGGPMQEFLTYVPEPSAVILLGTIAGLLGLTKLRRRRQA
jgi:hypothetical protein